MVSVVLGLLVCVGLALAVVALVAIPARRQGRDVLSERGEQVIESIRERQRGTGTGTGTGTGAAAGAPRPDSSSPRDDVVGAHG